MTKRETAEKNLYEALTELISLVQMYATIGDRLPSRVQAEYQALLSQMLTDSLSESVAPHIQFIDGSVRIFHQEGGRVLPPAPASIEAIEGRTRDAAELCKAIDATYKRLVQQSSPALKDEVLQAYLQTLINVHRTTASEEGLERSAMAVHILPGTDCDLSRQMRNDLLNLLYGDETTH